MTVSAYDGTHWEAIRPPAELAPEEVHLWRAPTALSRTDVARLWGALDLTEERRALRLPKGEARDAFVATRAALRLVLAGYEGVEAGALVFRYGVHGKPYLATQGSGRQLDFSVTHSGSLSIIAVAAAREIGIDAEREVPRRRAGRVARRLFQQRTASMLEALDAEDRVAAFAAAWTQREAFAKAVGSGVFRTSDELAFEWPRETDVRLCEEHRAGRSARVWSVAAVRPAHGYAATLVAEGAIDAVRCFDAKPLLER